MKFHPLANIFPLLEGQDFAGLVADIREHGLHEPIVVYEDKILDGRNRFRACEAAGKEPTFTVYSGDDPVAYVVSLNLRRRHLNETQRAMVAAKLATLKDGQRADLVEGLPIGRASELLNVGERSVARAREVQEYGTPELVSAVERGAVSVSAAADVATLPTQEQREIVAHGEKEILEAAKQIRARQMEERCSARIQKLAEISKNNSALSISQQYPVILADPPWYFKVYDSVSVTAGTARTHYPCMQTEDICAMPVSELATDDAVLFLWTTAPHLQESFRVIEEWGFQYATNIVWVKDKTGLGYWVKNQHELLLIATRGNIPSPAPSRRPASVINAPRREHSRKPDEAYALIERMYPTLPKIELFARQTRPGWAAWGNEVGTAA
jgi:N6-adenosine-specific RNA methylase IME4/ParB-like chromosome segregation protein Spo0J